MSQCDCPRCTNDRLDRQFFKEVAADLLGDVVPTFTLTLDEARALYRELAKQYINHENELAVTVVMNLGRFVDRFGK